MKDTTEVGNPQLYDPHKISIPSAQPLEFRLAREAQQSVKCGTRHKRVLHGFKRHPDQPYVRITAATRLVGKALTPLTDRTRITRTKMSPTTTLSVYTSLDAEKATQSGAFLTAWPTDETVISLPSLKDLSLEIGYRKPSMEVHLRIRRSKAFRNL
ncbi:hypothetical protein NOR_07302 [Metarhizium rileyi]|uniref:Uncharacterized protein n=1 Tax=Metarhizium rileyi (strain RCEF 4871) TaxID=1649241 RepID=A0A166YLA9_METRR|nr:hypothetical protein NOR_07302 [Metarhizium rileyi RCEF 4871]